MHVHNLLTLALLAGTAVAKPVARPHIPKHASNPTTTDTTPTCTATYTPSEDQDCHDIALKHGIQLSDPEANYDSRSTKCEAILCGYGICPDETRVTTSSTVVVTAVPSVIPASNGTNPSSPINGTIPTNSTTNTTLAHAGVVTLTELSSQTLTYTEGTGSAARERVVVVTHTTIDVVVETATTTVTASGHAAESAAGVSSTIPSTESPSAFPTNNAVTTDSTAPATSSSISISVVDVSSQTTTTLSSSIANSGVAMAPVTASSCAATVPPPASTQAGIVSGCSQWYVAVPGDYCASVAERYGIPVDTFMAWNPAVDPPTCPSMLAGSAYCVATCDGALAETSSALQATPSIVPSSMSTMSTTTPSTSLSIPGVTTSSTVTSVTAVPIPPGVSTSTPPATPTEAPASGVKKTYTGDGSVAAGWPSIEQWISFDSMFSANEPDMKASCAQWGVPDDSDQEIAEMRNAILQIAAASRVDARFILAVIMQESTGCVRVITTQYSVFNPGLMQSHNGTGSCNENNVSTDVPTTGPYISNGRVQTPCPQSEIAQMIKDGTRGTTSGDGLEQLLDAQRAAYSGAQAYYRAARAYNGGSSSVSDNLESGCCTASYVSDIANRLLGWVSG